MGAKTVTLLALPSVSRALSLPVTMLASVDSSSVFAIRSSRLIMSSCCASAGSANATAEAVKVLKCIVSR